jgi:hypothetical protein
MNMTLVKFGQHVLAGARRTPNQKYAEIVPTGIIPTKLGTENITTRFSVQLQMCQERPVAHEVCQLFVTGDAHGRK